MTLFMILALLLGAGEAVAEDRQCWEYNADSWNDGGASGHSKRVPCLDPDVPTPVKPCCVPDCLAQMEAAMRVMEPYLYPPPLSLFETSEVKRPCDERCRIAKRLIELDERDKADALWHATKSCWRTP